MVVSLEVSLNLKLTLKIPVEEPVVDVGLFGRITINLLVMVMNVDDILMIMLLFKCLS